MGTEGSDTSVSEIEGLEIIGGRLAIMFINTANWIDGEAVDDRLKNAQDLLRWAQRVAIPTSDTETRPQLGKFDLADLRHQIRQVFETDQLGEDLTSALVALINDLAEPGEDAPSRNCRFILSAILFSAIEIIATETADHIRRCPGARCGWMFIDDSPGNRRRWCSMASCGNRAKARRHYQQTKSASAAPPP